MFAIQKMIDSGLRWLLTVCILPLCLAVSALGTAASPANPAARAGDLPLPLISSRKVIDPPDIIFPKPPPPPPYQMPPPSYRGTTAMDQTA